MDLFIETLIGTAFELRVSPFETVMNVKAKIQRLEGIPVSQQHLIWRSMELEDDYCLHDYDINDGATLQLVLAMRGGPINMKRVPVEDNSLREMAEYVEANRDEIWDKLPKDNRQVTFLVFRDGEQYNVYRVVDRGDGTLTPLSDSLSGASLYNLYDDEDEENSVSIPQETIQENNVTMNKMKLLRSKMQSLHMSKKAVDVNPGLFGTGRAWFDVSGGAISKSEFGESRGGGGGTSVEQVAFQPHSPPSTARIMYQPRPPSKEKHSKFQPRPPSGERPSSSSLAAARRRLRRSSSSHYGLDHRDGLQGTCVNTQDKKLYHTYSRESSGTSQVKAALPPINKTKNSNNIDISEFVRTVPEEPAPAVPSFRGRTLSKHNVDSGRKPPSNPSMSAHKPLPNVGETSENSKESCKERSRQHFSSTKVHSRLGSTEHCHSKDDHSPGKKIAPLKEKKSSVERLRSGFLNDSLSRVHRTHQSNIGTIYSNTDAPVVRSRPPPPPQLASGKKTRCSFCRKKTGLATTYICRCGSSFCATHRYAETHNCNFDYKTEGRKLLEQSNPLVVAPKLPKI